MTTYGLEEDIGQNHHNVTSCQFYDKECVTKSILEPNNDNQVERTKLNEIKGKSENTLDSKIDLTKQQIILVTNRNKFNKNSNSNCIIKKVKVIDARKTRVSNQIKQKIILHIRTCWVIQR